MARECMVQAEFLELRRDVGLSLELVFDFPLADEIAAVFVCRCPFGGCCAIVRCHWSREVGVVDGRGVSCQCGRWEKMLTVRKGWPRDGARLLQLQPPSPLPGTLVSLTISPCGAGHSLLRGRGRGLTLRCWQDTTGLEEDTRSGRVGSN